MTFTVFVPVQPYYRQVLLIKLIHPSTLDSQAGKLIVTLLCRRIGSWVRLDTDKHQDWSNRGSRAFAGST